MLKLWAANIFFKQLPTMPNQSEACGEFTAVREKLKLGLFPLLLFAVMR